MAGAISSLERAVLRHGGALSPFTCTAVLPATSFSGACSHGSSSCGCRCMHASASSLKGTTQQGAAPKLPAGWKWSGTGKEERKAYNTQMAGYRRAVGKLRNEWTPLVHAHNAKVAQLKAAAEVEFLARQDENLERQFKRWVSPRVLTTSQERRPDPVQRQEAYARHELRAQLVAAAHAAVVEQVMQDSATWVRAAALDKVIAGKLNAAFDAASSPRIGLFEKAPMPARDLYDVHECIAGIPSKRGVPGA